MNGLSPDAPLPYTVDEVKKIGKCANVEGSRRLVGLRHNLRMLADNVQGMLRFNTDVPATRRRDYVHKEVINPADQLIQAIDNLDGMGCQDDFGDVSRSETYVNPKQLRRDLIRFRDWAADAMTLQDSVKGPRVKGETAIRQYFVDNLLDLFITAAPDNKPTRTVGRDKTGKSHEDSAFTQFVRLCAKPVLGEGILLDAQIKKAIKSYGKK